MSRLSSSARPTLQIAATLIISKNAAFFIGTLLFECSPLVFLPGAPDSAAPQILDVFENTLYQGVRRLFALLQRSECRVSPYACWRIDPRCIRVTSEAASAFARVIILYSFLHINGARRHV